MSLKLREKCFTEFGKKISLQKKFLNNLMIEINLDEVSLYELQEATINYLVKSSQVEKLVKNSKDRVSKIKLKPTDTIDLEEKLAEILGLEVIISDNGKRGGNIKVKYKTLDQLALVTNKLKM